MEDFHDTENQRMEKIKYFIASLENTSWMYTADEKIIDSILNTGVQIQEYINKPENGCFNEKLCKEYPGFNFKRSASLAMETFIKSPQLHELLTLYAINKYMMLFPKHDIYKLLDNMYAEEELRENLVTVIQQSNEGSDIHILEKVNNFLSDLDSGNDDECNEKITNALRTQTIVLLNAVKHTSHMNGQRLVGKMIFCLEAQSDLKLWFTVMKQENLGILVELCTKHQNLLQAVFRFFDKFSNELETNYDEDLNTKYSHVNMDFDEFVVLVKMFLNTKSIRRDVYDYLENKTVSEDNFLFWIDVKACIPDDF